jgi:hypothetical protein
MKGAGTLYLKQGKTREVVIEAENNIIPLIKTEVHNGILSIYPERCIKVTKNIAIHVTMDVISALSAEGSTSIIGESQIESAKLQLTTNGNSRLLLDMNVKELGVAIRGSGTAIVKGKAPISSITITGAGTIKGYDLLTRKTSISSEGATEAEVYASEELDVNIRGVGKVSYKGNPAVMRKQIAGLGRLSKAD